MLVQAVMDQIPYPQFREASARRRARIHARPKALMVVAALVGMHCSGTAHAVHTGFQVSNDGASYSAVLLQQRRVEVNADFDEEGEIDNGEAFGIFQFDFDPHLRLAWVPGIVGGLAIGAASEDGSMLGGDEGFTLHVTPGPGITPFGAIIAFDEPGVRHYFRLVVGCPDEPCSFPPSPPDPALSGLGPSLSPSTWPSAAALFSVSP